RGRRIGRVVGRVGAGDGDAADVHALGCADVFVGKTRTRVAAAQRVARDPIIHQGHRGVGGPVINPVRTRGADHQRARGDVRRRAGGGVGRVVGCVRAADGDGTDA